jgi:hypothetical protein
MHATRFAYFIVLILLIYSGYQQCQCVKTYRRFRNNETLVMETDVPETSVLLTNSHGYQPGEDFIKFSRRE